jgi:hypothetical protein
VPVTLEAPGSLRRLILGLAFVLMALELALGVMLWRLSSALAPDADERTAAAFLLLGTVMTLQAMVVIGLAWMIVAISRTTLRHDATGVTLEHPWRRWHGDPGSVRHAWRNGPWLALELEGHWRRWYVWARGQENRLAEVRAVLPAGAWLEGASRQRHLARTVLPPLLLAVGTGGLMVVWILWRLDRLL